MTISRVNAAQQIIKVNNKKKKKTKKHKKGKR
jgi:hypothetical protein